MKFLFLMFCFLYPVTALAQHEAPSWKKIHTISANKSTSSVKSIYDKDMLSPKSAVFSKDGHLLYVNALEASKTLIFSVPSFKRVGEVGHTLTEKQKNLFVNDAFFQKNQNIFSGKPVEMALTHGGRYLLVPYYRRSFDQKSVLPSALAVIDTKTYEKVRIIQTGPIPKFVSVSHDEKKAAVIHWGDNTVMMLNTESSNPFLWFFEKTMVVEKRLSMKNITGDRDKVCGFCLRGAVFSRDNKTLLVARMGGGGIAGFDVPSGSYLGTVMNVPSTPRHLVIQREDLLVSSNVAGTLARFSLSEIVSALRAAKGKRVQGPRPEVLKVGQGARTLEVSPDGRYAFVATNTSQSIAVVDLASFKKIKTLPASPFPVGLAISPNGCFLVSTSQGKPGRGGGNTVDIWSKC